MAYDAASLYSLFGGKSKMESVGKRKRRDESAITNFTDLRDSSVIQTGPKRQRKSRGKDEGSLDISRRTAKTTPRTELLEAVHELKESAVELSDLTPAPPPSKHPLHTPTPKSTPHKFHTRTSSRKKPRKSALRSLHPLPTTGTHKRSHPRVSFGEHVLLSEYSPELSPRNEEFEEEQMAEMRMEEEEEGEEEEDGGHDEKRELPLSEHPPPSHSASEAGTKRARISQTKGLPRSLIGNLFTSSCKRRVSRGAMDLIMKFTELYLKQASEDASVYAGHAGRKTVEVQDIVLLLRRQRFVSESKRFEYLVNTHLPLEYVQELLPCAYAGKCLVPELHSHRH